MKYLSRVADKMLQERLETFGAVLKESLIKCFKNAWKHLGQC